MSFQSRQPQNPLEYVKAEWERDIPSMVRSALAENRAQLAFQRIVPAHNTGVTAFFEGLIRIKDGHGHMIPARHFMTDIEETALGRDIDCASLRLGIEMLRQNPTTQIAINMSARSLADGKWRNILVHGLQSHKVGRRLILEISESSAMSLHENVVRFIEECRPYGVCFSLDDFGAGEIAFRRLKDFHFDMVKIDKCFIRDVHNSADNQSFVKALVSVAHQFDMVAVAEGVESKSEAQFLQSVGVDCLQGYLFGVPRLKL